MIKSLITNNLVNLLGWKTNRKIIVFESDDWGSIRISSKDSYNALIKAGIKVNQDPYCRYDALESENDLIMLFDVLSKHKDRYGNRAVFTANTIVANPDFDKIVRDDFENYYFEPVTDTFKSYPEHSNCFNLWKQGNEDKVFRSQFHGREHLNVERWMHALKSKSQETHTAFNMKIFGLSTTISNEKRASYMAAFDADSMEQIESQKSMLENGLDLFTELFGYESESFIAPNYTWSKQIEETLHLKNVKFIQGSRIQRLPNPGKEGIKKQMHYTGQKNKRGQIYTVRNVTFEPSSNESKDWINSCLKQINESFKSKKPAIISSHRLNYIGFIDESNRDKNLRLLDELLKKIISKWPDVEFMASDALGRLIAK